MNALYVFLAQMALNSFILVFGLCIWKIAWVDNFPSFVPRGNYTADIPIDRNEFFKAQSFSDIMTLMYKVISDFDSHYWIDNVGFDGYSYLYLQRQFLGFLSNIIFLGLLLLAVVMGMRSMNQNSYYFYYIESIFMPYKLSIFMFIITALFINKLIFIRKHLQRQYIDRLFGTTRSHGLDWMKLRTIHVQGVPQGDLNGDMLRHKIDTVLEDNGIYKRVDQLTIIPGYSRLLKLEQKLRELERVQQVMNGEFPFLQSLFLKICLPKSIKDQMSYESKKLSLQRKIDQELLQKYEGSGHAIINFESIEAAKFCLEKYSPNKTFFQIIFESIKDTCTKCCQSKSSDRTRSRAQSAESEIIANFKDFSIICTEVPDPSDIAWLNIEGEFRGLYIWRRCLINVFFIFMLLFFSTPAAIFAFVQKYFKIDFFSFGWTDYIPKPFGPLMKLYCPALVIVMLNQFVILFIDIVTFQEKFKRHSVFQISIFHKYYLYLMLNVVIVPAFLMAQQDSLYEILIGNVQINLRESFNRLYTEDHGMVYSIIVSQSAAVSLFVYINRIGDVVMNYFSTYLTYHKRLYQNDEQNYLRTGDEVFQYGYFYSQMLMVFSIVLQFMQIHYIFDNQNNIKQLLSSTWILSSGVIYFFLRHCLDSYLLLTIHTQEIESSGVMVNTALRYAMIGLLLFQVQFLTDFYLKQDLYQMIIAGVLIFFSLVIFFILRKPLFDIDLMQDNTIDYARYNKTEIKHEWRKLYKHPLVINPFASTIPKEIKKTGFQLKRPKQDKPQIGQQQQSNHRHSHSSKHQQSSKQYVHQSQNQKHDEKQQQISKTTKSTYSQGQTMMTSASQKQSKSKFSQVRNAGFATDTDNGINTRDETTDMNYNSRHKFFQK